MNSNPFEALKEYLPETDKLKSALDDSAQTEQKATELIELSTNCPISIPTDKIG